MKAKMKKKGVASIEELRELCQEAEVKLIACQMTVDLFDMDAARFIDGVEFAGRRGLLRVCRRERHLSLHLTARPRADGSPAAAGAPRLATAPRAAIIVMRRRAQKVLTTSMPIMLALISYSPLSAVVPLTPLAPV